MTRMFKLQAGEIDLVEGMPPSQVELLRREQDPSGMASQRISSR
jgi:hypothetical protein